MGFLHNPKQIHHAIIDMILTQSMQILEVK